VSYAPGIVDPETKDRALQTLTRVPPFRSPGARRRALAAWRGVRRGRRRLFEGLGSERYSRPGILGLDRHLPDRGFFVEAGAHDGYIGSNTYYVARFRGWSGVLIEPIPALYECCVSERSESKVFNCALVRSGFGRDEVVMRYGGPQSVVKGAWEWAAANEAPSQLEWSQQGCAHGWEARYEVGVPARTLTSVLDEADAPATIDLLSLDVEGYELEVLKGLDFARYTPTLIVLEFFEGLPGRDELGRLLADYDEIDRLSPSDLLFRRK
jgi:FkbM family methyltransferase